ncbi:MAG: hypothetical protein WC827_01605 [Candidatus Paceibacterota bacterium]|jgi:hypothetical protein
MINVRKKELNIRAINLRKSGKTYSEILKIIPVAKSTLSEWLRDVGIAKHQKQAFTEKRRLASLSGGLARKRQRIELSKGILNSSETEIGKISDRELWLIGTALYWAEGSKEKEYAPGSGIKFSNSDPKMIIVFLKWLTKICKIQEGQMGFEIYIHDNHRNEVQRFKEYWSNMTGFDIKFFDTVYFKKNIIKTKRKNIGDLYFGLLRVKVLKSSTLNRKVQGWVNGILKG